MGYGKEEMYCCYLLLECFVSTGILLLVMLRRQLYFDMIGYYSIIRMDMLQHRANGNVQAAFQDRAFFAEGHHIKSRYYELELNMYVYVRAISVFIFHKKKYKNDVAIMSGEPLSSQEILHLLHFKQ